ncbi:MAG: efflux RND transporter permease subunit, partial [Desulfobacteraceae bacterium]
MNNCTVLEKILNRRRLILSIAGFLSLLGIFMWSTMTRQEDPRLPDFWGQVVAIFPGADAETVEHLVLEPIEDALAEVSEIKKIEATAYDETAVLVVELRGDVTDFREAWDEVREALTKAYSEFPDGAFPPSLDDDQTSQDSIVYAVTGSSDLIELLDGARKIKKELLFLSSVARVDLVADPGEQVTVDLDDRTAKRIDISLDQLAYQLRSRNNIIAGGSLHLNDKTVRLRPLSEFKSIEEIRSTPIMLPSGSTV